MPLCGPTLRRHLVFLAAQLVPLVAGGVAGGKVVLDGSVGPPMTVARLSGAVSYTIPYTPANLLDPQHHILLQSFSSFDLHKGDVAKFLEPPTVLDVIARVTGGPTTINGTIAFSNGSANFILIDASGIKFGRNAAIANESGGSLAVTTADFVRLGNGFRINAAGPAVLTTRAPAAFGFLQPHPASITINASTHGLSVRSGGKFVLSAIAGSVTLDGGQLQARQGQANLIAVGSAGRVNSNPVFEGDVTVDAAGPEGVIQIKRHSVVDTGQGGHLNVVGGSCSITGGSLVEATVTSGASGSESLKLVGSLTVGSLAEVSSRTEGAANGPAIQIDAGAVDLHRGTIRSVNSHSSGATGGAIALNVGSLTMTDSGEIDSAPRGDGVGGSIAVTAAREVSLDGSMGDLATAIAAITQPGSSAAGGDIQISAPQITLLSSALFSATAKGSGVGGKLTVNAGTLYIDGRDNPLITGLESRAGTGTAASPATGNAGVIRVTAQDVDLLDGGVITASTFGLGNAGRIHLQAAQLTMQGDRAPDVFTGLFSRSGDQAAHSGNGGTIRVAVDGGISISGGAEIACPSLGPGSAGDIIISQAASLMMNDGTISCLTGGGGVVPNFKGSQTVDLGPSANGNGSAGGIDIHVGGVASLANGSSIDVSAQGFSPIPGGVVTAGNVHLQASQLSLSGGSSITSSTTTTGKGGNLALKAGNVAIDDSQVAASSTGSGDSGTVRVHSLLGSAVLNDQAVISTSASDGLGRSSSGAIELISAGNIEIAGRSRITAQSTGDSGNVLLSGGGHALVVVTDSRITNHAGVEQHAGKSGGFITIDPAIVALNDSTIDGLASGQSQPVTIDADALLESADSRILTNQPNFAVDTDVASQLITLPAPSLANTLSLEPACAHVAQGNISSFVVSGAGGVAPTPGGWLLEPDEKEGAAAQ